MSQLLRRLIVIITLLPSCLCFAQESANKTPSSSSAQKPETKLQRPDSARVQNPDAELPAAIGAIQKVELSPEANSWAVQIISRGGFAGTGRGDLTITSQGHLVWNAVENQCNVKLRDDVLQILTQTALSAKASGWGGSTAGVCDDCYVYGIALQRRERDGIERMYIAYWDSSTAGKISGDLRKVYDTFMAHKGCKQ
jgi:hypothetical protein